MMALQVLQAAVLLAKYSPIGHTLLSHYGAWMSAYVIAIWLIRRYAL